MKNNNLLLKAASIALAVLVSASVLSGCSAGASANYMVEETAASYPMDGASYDIAAEEAYEADYSSEMAYAKSASDDAISGNGQNIDQLKENGRKLIRTVYLSIESKDINETAKNICSDVEKLGGYIESSSVYNNDYSDAYYTCRIPSDKVDEFLASVEGLGNVTSHTENIDDITLQYTDTESHKKALKAEEERLLELMDMAETVEDLVIIEDKLSDVRYQIDSIESQLRTYDNQIDYTTVSIDAHEVQSYTPATEKTIGERIKTGLASTIENLGIFFEDFFVWFIVSLPVLLILGILAVIIVLVIKSIRKKKAKKVAKDENINSKGSESDDKC